MKTKYIVALATAILLPFVSTKAQPVDAAIGAGFGITTALSVSPGADLAFGTFTAPTITTDVWTIDPATGFINHLGGGNSLDVDNADHQIGGFTITGDPLAILHISFTITDFSSGTASLGDVFFSPDIGSIIPPSLDATGNLDLKVGGALLISTTALPGPYSDAKINLTVNY